MMFEVMRVGIYVGCALVVLDLMTGHRLQSMVTGSAPNALTKYNRGVDYLVLGREDQLLFLCWHFFADGVGTPYIWTKLTDIALLLAPPERLDWGHLAERARRRRRAGRDARGRLGCAPSGVAVGGRAGDAGCPKVTLSGSLGAASTRRCGDAC